MPHDINPEDEEHNKGGLLESLNTKDCFDVVLDIREDDALELHFNCSQELVYAFIFRNARWEITSYDPFAGVKEVEAGKIARALP